MRQIVPIVPLNNMVLGIQEKTTAQTRSGLYLPQMSQKRTALTRIVAIGPDVEGIATGNRVVYKDYSQHEVTYDDVDYLLIEETDILAKIKEDS